MVAMPSPLSGVTVVEIDGDLPIQFCGRALADLGASVTKVEPVSGDPLRREPPLTADGTSSVVFEALNGGKELAVIDRNSQEGRARLEQLAASCDVVLIAEGGPKILLRPREVIAELEAVVRRSDGSPGRVEPLTRFHASGSGSLFPVRDPGLRPASAGRFIFDAMYGVAFAGAITTALVGRKTRARQADPAVVRFSTKAYGPWLEKMFVHRVALEGVDLRRTNHMYPYGGNIACRDGHICIYIVEEHQWHHTIDMIGKPDWHADPRFADGVARARNATEIQSALEEWCAAHKVDDVIDAARRADVPAGRVSSPSGMLDRPSMRKRGFVAEVADGGVAIRTPFGPAWNSGGHPRTPGAVRVGADQP
jgi:crotonobetainyl-CoA:carnitine CoA-transferase CaiB-like acyl-CoA transferase